MTAHVVQIELETMNSKRAKSVPWILEFKFIGAKARSRNVAACLNLFQKCWVDLLSEIAKDLVELAFSRLCSRDSTHPEATLPFSERAAVN